MPDYIDTLGTISSDRLDRRVVRQRTAQIDELSIHARCDNVAAHFTVESLANSGARRDWACLAIRDYRDFGTRNFSAHNES
jgi:hypothetical protein